MSTFVIIQYGGQNPILVKNAQFVQTLINENYPSMNVEMSLQQMSSSSMEVTVVKNSIHSLIWSNNNGDGIISATNKDIFLSKLNAAV